MKNLYKKGKYNTINLQDMKQLLQYIIIFFFLMQPFKYYSLRYQPNINFIQVKLSF